MVRSYGAGATLAVCVVTGWTIGLSAQTREKAREKSEIVTFQNYGGSKLKDCYLGVDRDTGKVIMLRGSKTGEIYWRITETALGHKFRTLCDGDYLGCYLDVDPKTGDVFVSKSPNSAVWKITDESEGRVTLQAIRKGVAAEMVLHADPKTWHISLVKKESIATQDDLQRVEKLDKASVAWKKGLARNS